MNARGDGIITFLDEGGGITELSLKRLKYLIESKLLGQALFAWCVFEHGYNFNLWSVRDIENSTGEIEETTIVTLLSGFNCGYGGEGPHGLITALELLGLTVTDEDKNTIFRHTHVYIDWWKRTIVPRFPPKETLEAQIRADLRGL